MDLVIQTLNRKRAEILGAIKRHEAQIAQAKHDLAHINATLKILDGPSDGSRAYIVSQGFFAKGEIAEICQRHLADGPLNTRELAERVMAEKGLEITDTPLRNSVVYKVVQALRHARRRDAVRMLEKRKGCCVWSTRTHEGSG
ncbi:hypothetical protein [Palleronia caenipelagi]|uniref:Uncharacterized protein n=1 Tax=Palleronia caenipelagi TaxID=2489174 RepID=A0A547PK51_9RHOB|nr:hypothetical protein [Palleronia caenipelagi]TRD14536.1 hypothetical protein FEV53_18750 [Palleronia caenipelagi]